MTTSIKTVQPLQRVSLSGRRGVVLQDVCPNVIPEHLVAVFDDGEEGRIMQHLVDDGRATILDEMATAEELLGLRNNP